jgi:hypothetical protein
LQYAFPKRSLLARVRAACLIRGKIMKDPIAWRLIRWLYGAYFVCLGAASALEIIGVLPEPHWEQYMSEASAAFLAALEATGFVMPLIIFTWVASGLALMSYRTAPLGVVLLAPVIVNIFLTDTLLDSEWLWATAHAAPLVALAWHFRSAYRGLWNYPPPAEPARVP